MELGLKDKVAIITGGAKGIGRRIALDLIGEKAIIVIADIDEKACAEIKSEISNLGGVSITTKTDVTNESSVKEMINNTMETFGKVDILINSAGYISISKPTDIEQIEWDKTMNVNVRGVFLCCKHVLKYMIKRNYGKILNISSQASKLCYPYESHYSASKAAVDGFTRSLACFAAEYGINANSICPGSIDTEMNRAVTKKTAELMNMSFEERWNKTIENTPLKRKGSVDDISNIALFLVSDKSGFMTGQSINVTGGRLMH